MSYTDLVAEPSQLNEEAFEQLMKKYEPLIVSTANRYATAYRRHLRGAADHDDLIQIARIAFWEANCLFDPKKVDDDKNPEYVFTSFARKTIQGRLSDRLRKIYRRAKREALSPTAEPFDIPDESPESIETQMYDLLEEWLFLLSPRERQYLALRLFKDWETKQIAAATNVSENTVRSWKKSLRKKLQPLQDSLTRNK
ncbi:sigma-70 family RNA polymerase sigma factor [Sporolactobacillus sp. THM7-7]|nr:sigma-70 family RNA polymerase sigma factor [Sporolactobacillus sp. THM7-7]